MKQFSIFFLLLMSPIFAWCNDGDLFTAKSQEGVMITYKIISEQEKTACVGDDNNPAIDVNTQGIVSIPQNANGYKIVKIGRRAFMGCKYISSVLFHDGIKNIDAHAFSECSNLQIVNIPYGINKIENCVFKECDNLQSVVIPATVKDFGICIFLSDHNLKSVTSYIINPSPLHPSVFSTFPYLDWDSNDIIVLDPELRNEATLYVPKGCKEKYEQTQGWNIFHDIVEMEYFPYDLDGDGKLTLNDITMLINIYLEKSE